VQGDDIARRTIWPGIERDAAFVTDRQVLPHRR